MNASPYDEVAVNVRPPHAEAPVSTPITEFSPSASTSSASRVPSATNLHRSSIMGVCGVMGKMARTSGRHRATASEAARLPSTMRTCPLPAILVTMLYPLLSHDHDRAHWTLAGADATAFAVVQFRREVCAVVGDAARGAIHVA